MANVTITNVSSRTIFLTEIDDTLEPGASTVAIVRNLPELEAMPELMTLWSAGDLFLALDIANWEWELRRFIDFAPGSNTWSFQSNSAEQYAGGFYDFASADNDFDPSIAFGTTAVGVAAHFSIVTGAVATTEIQITITGTSITDTGVQTGSDSEIITIPEATAADSYFETLKKWNGEITIETTAGTAVTCNYGWTKYWDHRNEDFQIIGFEAIWESDSTDSSSDIVLIHHKATGWTFNSGAKPDRPTPIASLTGDHPGNTTLKVGQGAWKRSDLATDINGADGEGVLFCVLSGNLGVGTLSFRSMTLELVTRKLPTSVT